jgi:hypothetical protein
MVGQFNGGNDPSCPAAPKDWQGAIAMGILANPMVDSAVSMLRTGYDIYNGDYYGAGEITGDRATTAAVMLATGAAGKLLPKAIRALRKPACSFSADTAVSIAAGSTAISSIKVGDTVQAYDPNTGETGPHTVTAVTAHTDPAVEHLTLDTGTIETTPNHPFFTLDRGWVLAGSLKVGEQVRTESGVPATVLGFTVSATPTTMWDLTVEGAHTFFVGSGAVLVHNCPIEGPGSGPGYRVRVGGGKAAATDIPSWARQLGFPKVGENGRAFATRLMDKQYGPGNWYERSAEFSQIKKYGDRGFQDP